MYTRILWVFSSRSTGRAVMHLCIWHRCFFCAHFERRRTMGERTINQKSFKEIWEKINVPFPEEAYEATAAGQRRIKEKCIKQRLDDVFGCCNYDLLIGKPMLEYGLAGRITAVWLFHAGLPSGMTAERLSVLKQAWE